MEGHQLTGNRKDVWSSHVTRNWRLTFRVEDGENGTWTMKTTIEEEPMRMLNPVHPGQFLRTEILDAYELSVTDAAKALGVSRPTLSSLLNAKAGLSGEMAVRFEKAFGVDMETLMRMQNSFDIASARRRTAEVVVERFVPRVAA